MDWSNSSRVVLVLILGYPPVWDETDMLDAPLGGVWSGADGMPLRVIVRVWGLIARKQIRAVMPVPICKASREFTGPPVAGQFAVAMLELSVTRK